MYQDLKALIKKESERIRKSCASAAFPIIMRQLVWISAVLVLWVLHGDKLYVLCRAFDALLKKAKIEVEQRVQAAQFLQENGVLVHFEDPFRRLNELYILDPGWLCDMVARVRKLKKQHYPTQGVRLFIMMKKPVQDTYIMVARWFTIKLSMICSLKKLVLQKTFHSCYEYLTGIVGKFK